MRRKPQSKVGIMDLKGKKRCMAGSTALLAIVLSILLSSIFVAAEHSATVAITPTEIYETTRANFTFTLSNDILSKHSISRVNFDVDDLTIISLYTPTGWVTSLAASSVEYFTVSSAISSWGTQNYLLELKAKKVDSTITSGLDIVTEDSDNESTTNTVDITILNDDTAPLLADWLPVDGMYLKEGTDGQDTHITAEDNETGVEAVFFNHADCSALTDVISTNLSVSANYYSTLSDLSRYADSTHVCFSFNALNYGGELGTVSGELIIDGKAPEVSLISPTNGKLMNALSEFVFNATDNLAPELYCDLIVDGNVESSVNATNGFPFSIPVANVSEGEHSWSVRCADLAGWQAESENRTYILDRTPPQFTLITPAKVIIKQGTPITIGVTDNRQLQDAQADVTPSLGDRIISLTQVNISGISAQFEFANTTWWAEEVSPYIITVNATDAAGNIGTAEFAFFIDQTAPNITLLSPPDDSENTYDVHTNFTFNVSENYESIDPIIACGLYLNGTLSGASVNINTTSGIQALERVLAPGNYSWNVRCADSVGNEGVSESWALNVLDLTGPDMVINPAQTTVRGTDMGINATITDVSGIDEDSITANVSDASGTVLPVILYRRPNNEFVGMFSTTKYSPVGDYLINIYAEDSVNNGNNVFGMQRVTYAFVIYLEDIEDMNTAKEVLVKGTVRYDNGSDVPSDQNVTLELLSSTVVVPVHESGKFTYTFPTVGTAGDYTVHASVIAPNGLTFTDSESFKATVPGNSQESVVSSSSSSTSSSSFDCGVNQRRVNGRCVSDGVTSNQPNLVRGSTQSTTIVNNPPTNDTIVQRSPPVIMCKKDNKCDISIGETCSNCEADCGACPLATGSATGFLNIISENINGLLWALLILASIVLILGYTSRKVRATKNSADLGIDSYLEQRSKQKKE